MSPLSLRNLNHFHVVLSFGVKRNGSSHLSEMFTCARLTQLKLLKIHMFVMTEHQTDADYQEPLPTLV